MQISLWLCFFQQALCSLCVLLPLGPACGRPRPRLPQLALATGCGGAVGALSLVLPPAFTPALALGALLLPWLCYAPCPPGVALRMALAQGAAMLLLSGTLRLLSRFAPLAAALPLCCLALCRLSARPGRAPKMQCATLHIVHRDQSVRLTALVDSGNLLRDGITQLPVIVLSQAAAARLVPLPAGNQLSEGMRYLPIRTASGPALMAVFRPDEILLTGYGHPHRVHALLGVSPDADAGFTALAPACLLETIYPDHYEGGKRHVHGL